MSKLFITNFLAIFFCLITLNAKSQIKTEKATFSDMVEKFDSMPSDYYYHFITDNSGKLIKKIEGFKAFGLNSFRFWPKERTFVYILNERVSTGGATTETHVKREDTFQIDESSIQYIPSNNSYSFNGYKIQEENITYNPRKIIKKTIDDDVVYYFMISNGKKYFNSVTILTRRDDGNLDTRRFYDQ
ncbi:hypothetical protein [Halpernia sp.]|uniref:hypothetical protein n=1 Tax=Halpernia sp. TaxID=2782209 RepID=UPI003A9496BD